MLLKMGCCPNGGSPRHKIGAMAVHHHYQQAWCSCHESLEIPWWYHHPGDNKQKNQESHIQANVDTLVNRAFVDKFQLNETKCKEPHINFSTKKTTSFDHVVVNDMPIELVATAKIPGLSVSSDLKRNCHIDSIIKKAKKHL